MAVLMVVPTLLSCAKQGAPQGGPPDTTPPTVDITIPGSADVLVAHDRGLALQFSEPIEKATLETGFTIAPPRSGEPEFRWSSGSRRVDLTWTDSLRDSTTYRVTLTTRVSDRRGNKLAQPYTFAFSTGDHVDRGEIRGQVHSADGKLQSYDAFAYQLDLMPDTFWLSPPDYVTQTGTEGRFQLPFLREGQYRLLILTDANRNHKLDQGEQFALAPRDLFVGDEILPDSVILFPSVYDTVAFSLISCAAAGAPLIELTFSQPLDTTRRADWLITGYDSVLGLPVEIIRIDPSTKRTNALTIESNWISGSVYTFSAEQIWDQRGRDVSVSACNLAFPVIVDSVGPKIESAFLPTAAAGMTPRDPIVWIFSEPIDSSRLAGHVKINDTSGAELGGNIEWSGPQSLTFTPVAPWPDTIEVLATIDSLYISDRVGNPAGVGVYKWRFRPLGESSMGVIEGLAESSLSSLTDYWIEVHELAKSRNSRVRLNGPGRFMLSVPAGRWMISGFIDANGDGRWSAGTLNPYSAPELRAAPSDTLDVRARFTLEDIILRF